MSTESRDPPRPVDPRPQPPPAPDPADCCGEGCVRCIHDIHDAAMERYELRLAEWLARQARRSG